jgi:hypothetical protein
VEVVAVVLLLVVGLVVELLLLGEVVLLVEVVGVLLVLELVLELLVELEVLLLVGVVLADVELVWQSWAASCLILLAPWLRSACRFELIVEGRFATPSVSALAALDAAPH